jgi:hypothetical protein
MVHNITTEVFQREAKHVSTFIAFSNEYFILRQCKFGRLNHQLEPIFQKTGATNDILLDRRNMLQILELHDLARSKLHIYHANTKRSSM